MTPERHTEIAKRAYVLWELEGQPTGRDVEHWLRAEAEHDEIQPAQTANEEPLKPRRPKALGRARRAKRGAR